MLRANFNYLCIVLCSTSDAITFDHNWPHLLIQNLQEENDVSNDILVKVIELKMGTKML